MNEYLGSCHCGLVKFKFHAENIFSDLYRCNCSLCVKKSIVMKSIKREDFFLLSQKENISEYQWNKRIARHFFCKHCGIYTHHNRRRDTSKISINITCVDDILLPKNLKVKEVNGASHD